MTDACKLLTEGSREGIVSILNTVDCMLMGMDCPKASIEKLIGVLNIKR
jgi:hypothetical protein